MDNQFSQHNLLKRHSFLQYMFWLLCQRSDGCNCVDLFLSLQFCSISLCACFCASSMMFLSLWLCSVVWILCFDTSTIALFAQDYFCYAGFLILQCELAIMFSKCSLMMLWISLVFVAISHFSFLTLLILILSLFL
jgi:hypothetical protein